MTVLRSVIMAFSCFSAIPVPQVAWTKKNMRYLMAAFPVVGLAVGAALWGWWAACDALRLGALVRAAGITCLPLLVTGGIHLDGFADVVDALSSHAEPARKREILHDPHVGAFAVMGVAGYLLCFFAFATELSPQSLPLMALAPVASRCLSGLATVLFPPASHKGMLALERGSAHTRVVVGVLCAILLATATLMLWSCGLAAALALAAALLALLWVRHVAVSQFGGMSGDLAGFYLQSAELAMLVCMVVAGRLVA